MVLLRRYAAAVLAASALTLGACGSEAPTITPEIPSGDAVNDPLIMTLNPGALVFQSNTATAPAPQWFGAGGLVTVGSGALFDPILYVLGGATAWAILDARPTFSRDPLEFRYQVSINQAAFAAMASGVYLARLPVRVPAARNTPQLLDIVLCKGAGCLAPGGSVTSTHDGSDPTWDRGVFGPGHFWEDYHVLVPAHSTVHLTMQGASCFAGFTHLDSYIYAYELDGTPIGQDDDGLCGLNSYLPVTNSSSSPKLIRVRTTSFAPGQGGTFLLMASGSAPFLMAEQPEPTAEELEIIRQKALSGN